MCEAPYGTVTHFSDYDCLDKGGQTGSAVNSNREY